MRMKTLTNLSAVLDEEIKSLSILTDDDLQAMLAVIERAYIHTMIEISLRTHPDQGVSREAKRLRHG
jgi:hypothetical protein